MHFDHEKLEVYGRALGLLDRVDQVLDGIAAGRGHLKDQLDRAVVSIVLNIAEGGGEFSQAEKQRFYRMAKRSATEVAAVLDILERRRATTAEQLATVRKELLDVAAMLTRLTKRSGG